MSSSTWSCGCCAAASAATRSSAGEGGGGHRRWRYRLLELLAQGGLAALSQGVVSFEIEDRAAQAGDELGKVDGFGVAVAHGALPLDHPREQGLAGCHQLVHASAQLRGCLFAGGDALLGRSHFPPQAYQLLRVDRKSTRLHSSHVRISYAAF